MKSRILIFNSILLLFIIAHGCSKIGDSSQRINFNSSIDYGSTKDIEGNTYKTVMIGTQVWMAENLKSIKYKDGTPIPLVTDNNAWNTLREPGYCCYNNDGHNYKSVYGVLYNWNTVETGNLCPSGWHVPSGAEWSTLLNYLGGTGISGAGIKLKETGTIHWQSTNSEATNESGFTALPGGYRDISGVFTGIGKESDWWCSDQKSGTAWFSGLNIDNSGIIGRNYHRIGYSVRCIQDY